MPLIKREMGWIKIGEEDPPKYEPLIVAYKGEFFYEADYDPVGLYGYVTVAFYDGYGWEDINPFSNIESHVGLKIDDVTHWRRLPHPPKD